MAEVDLTPNAGTAAAAQRGLDWLKEGYGGDGLVDATIADARKMANRQALSEEKVRRMPAWFARHEVDMTAPQNADSDNEDYPGPGAVAWALWGGDAGRSWAESKVKQLDGEGEGERALPEPDEAEPVLDVTGWLRVLLADLVTLKFRAQGFHWNVSGPQFPTFHELFGEVYALAEDGIDPVAENIRKLGPTSPFRLEEFISLRSLDDSPADSQEPVAMAADLQARNEILLDTLADAYYAAEEAEEPGLCNFLADRIDQHRKLDWQLRMVIGKPSPEPPEEEEVEEPEEEPADNEQGDTPEEAPDAAETALTQPREGDIEPSPARSGALTVEKRDGSTVSLRTATGEIREVSLPESRSMLAPISVEAPAEGEDENKAPVFRGHAAVFDQESEDLGGFTEVIARGAFRRALGEGQDTVALFNHDSNLVLGRTTNRTLDLREDPRGLHAEFNAPDTQYARDIRELVRRGDVHQMSFAFTVARDDWQERSDGTILRRVLEVDRLHDVSLVTTPAYPQTSAEAVRESLASESDSLPEPADTAVAGTEELTHDPREARLRELQMGAKRRMALVNAKKRQKG